MSLLLLQLLYLSYHLKGYIDNMQDSFFTKTGLNPIQRHTHMFYRRTSDRPRIVQ